MVILVVACHHAAPPPPPPPPRVVEVAPRDTFAHPPPSESALAAPDRDSLLREVQARRAVWRARNIVDYTIRVAVGCFCPWPSKPLIMEVRGGVPVALRDTTGKPAGPVREPWSAYTVDALFDAVEHAARTHDVVEVTYDPHLGYPTAIRGDAKRGQVDDWYWVRASELTPRR